MLCLNKQSRIWDRGDVFEPLDDKRADSGVVVSCCFFVYIAWRKTDYFQPFHSCPSFLSADIICVVLHKRTLRPFPIFVLSKSPDPLDGTQHFSTIRATLYLPAEVSIFIVALLCSKLLLSGWMKFLSSVEEKLEGWVLDWRTLESAVSRRQDWIFFLASCRCFSTSWQICSPCQFYLFHSLLPHISASAMFCQQ